MESYGEVMEKVQNYINVPVKALEGITLARRMVVQNPWTPTVRRGPIAAEFRGPGPAAFNIESTLGEYQLNDVKHEAKIDRIKPGPGSYQVEKVTRVGPDRVVAATISAKLKDPEKFNTPSPGCYSPEKNDIHELGPSYSFGQKLNDSKPNQNPSPNQYHLPDVLTSNYNSDMKSNPSYTIRAKTSGWVDKTKKPGPGAHSPEKVNLKKERPSYTFGCKHSPFAANLKANRK
ncbi:Outer dense fiber protein 3 [Nymphon striatum]|nr:Outer dense fiber protein 3 [Nymphon striatum]